MQKITKIALAVLHIYLANLLIWHTLVIGKYAHQNFTIILQLSQKCNYMQKNNTDTIADIYAISDFVSLWAYPNMPGHAHLKHDNWCSSDGTSFRCRKSKQ